MTQYNSVNVTLCNLKLNKLKSRIKNGLKKLFLMIRLIFNINYYCLIDKFQDFAKHL